MKFKIDTSTATETEMRAAVAFFAVMVNELNISTVWSPFPAKKPGDAPNTGKLIASEEASPHESTDTVARMGDDLQVSNRDELVMREIAVTALDANGLPWDERIHASSKAINADGSWRVRRGIADEVFEAVVAELRGDGPGEEPILLPEAPAQEVAHDETEIIDPQPDAPEDMPLSPAVEQAEEPGPNVTTDAGPTDEVPVEEVQLSEAEQEFWRYVHGARTWISVKSAMNRFMQTEDWRGKSGAEQGAIRGQVWEIAVDQTGIEVDYLNDATGFVCWAFTQNDAAAIETGLHVLKESVAFKGLAQDQQDRVRGTVRLRIEALGK